MHHRQQPPDPVIGIDEQTMGSQTQYKQQDYKQLLPFIGSLTFDTSSSSTTKLCIHNKSPTSATLTLSTETEQTFPKQQGYDNPHVFVDFKPSLSQNAQHLHFLGFQACEFALPVIAKDTCLDFSLFSRPHYQRPLSILPLLIFDKQSNQVCLLAPLDNFHTQVLTVLHDNEEQHLLRWGWSGDLTSTSGSFSTSLLMLTGNSPSELFLAWGYILCNTNKHNIVINNSNYGSELLSNISYWTDNGASYWYRTEEGTEITESINNAIQSVESISEKPIKCLELDSWFYRHEISRQVRTIDHMHIVPPSGLIKWEPRTDIFKNGSSLSRVNQFNKPLVLHTRHISSKSEYIINRNQWYIDKDRAHPCTHDGGEWLWDIWCNQAVSWGAVTIEHDWLVEVWQGIRQLRCKPQLINHWLFSFFKSCTKLNLSIVWCMATPADMAAVCKFAESSSIKPQVVRSCDDYRYSDDASTLWRWHLTTSLMLYALNLKPYKDVFMSLPIEKNGGINGDPNAWIEACLSTLSTGPVGIGDRIGKSDSKVLNACCRNDGLIIKPDDPLRIHDKSISNYNRMLWATCTSKRIWKYVFSVVTAGKWATKLNNNGVAHTDYLDFGCDVIVYDWKVGKLYEGEQRGKCIGEGMKPYDWKLWIVCPIFKLKGETFSIIGDIDMFACMGEGRVRIITKFNTVENDGNNIQDEQFIFHVIGVPGEMIRFAVFTSHLGLCTRNIKILSKGWNQCSISPIDKHLQINYEE